MFVNGQTSDTLAGSQTRLFFVLKEGGGVE